MTFGVASPIGPGLRPARGLLRTFAAWGLAAAIAAPPAARAEPQWNYLVGRVLQHPAAARAELINLAINQFDHADSSGATVWQSPQELVARGAGDCKDFALAKFWLLRHTGTARERVRLAYGEARVGDSARLHLVVLLWVDEGSPLVLDNLLPGMHRLNHRADLQIRFSFDELAFYDQIGSQRIRDQPLRGWRGLWARIEATTPPPRAARLAAL